MKHWFAILLAVLLTGCMRDPEHFRDRTRSYVPTQDLVPSLDQCISKNGQMVRCDRAN